MSAQDPTPEDVASWMLSKLESEEVLYQEQAAYEIQEFFGEEFVYENANGNLAISKPVLKAFSKITSDSIVWCRSDRYWRPRQDGDLPGRQQP